MLIRVPCFLVIALAWLIGSFSVPCADAAAPPTDLASRLEIPRLGLDVDNYLLWWTDDAREGHRILVASNERLLAADVGDLWDSGWRRNVRGEIRYAGKPLPKGSTVW